MRCEEIFNDRLMTYLNQGIFSQSGAAQCWRCTKESRIGHFLDSFSDTKYKSSIHEGHYDVSIILLCNQNYKAHSEYLRNTNNREMDNIIDRLRGSREHALFHPTHTKSRRFLVQINFYSPWLSFTVLTFLSLSLFCSSTNSMLVA